MTNIAEIRNELIHRHIAEADFVRWLYHSGYAVTSSVSLEEILESHAWVPYDLTRDFQRVCEFLVREKTESPDALEHERRMNVLAIMEFGWVSMHQAVEPSPWTPSHQETEDRLKAEWYEQLAEWGITEEAFDQYWRSIRPAEHLPVLSSEVDF